MPLRIIYGKSGTGKSNFIYNEINEKIKQNEKSKIYIITPEQFSFTAEKKLMENKKSVINTEVITFNRMAYRVMNEVGGNIHNSLTKCGKTMLIYSILQREKKNLNLLNKSDENIDLAMRTISEFKKNQVSIEELKKETENINDNYLKIKLKYLILIYEKFNDNIQNKYISSSEKERFHIITCVDGEGSISGGSISEKIKIGDSILIPANLGQYEIVGNISVLRSYVTI